MESRTSVDLVVEDNYEVAREAAGLIDQAGTYLDEGTLSRLTSRLEAARELVYPHDPERCAQVILPLLRILRECRDGG
ncbi:hypothetical protein [Actinoplanes siamensis]|uniref:Uncharacterized protein n=1 Tax=Actinoplanes siamensis TaxID=1223317 RepID=A0A919N6X0_9ACTN|nr:hypothetical protein [Actinoplanes siamensis]GIF05478.1 hypothetical protein Asi03nite_30160 [Actinoplanes siamensis]